MLTPARSLLRWLAALVVLGGWSGGPPGQAGTPSWVGKWVGPGAILELETGKSESFQSKFGTVEAGALSPDGTLLALTAASSLSAPEPRSIEVIDRGTGKQQTLMRIEGGASLEWSPDGRYLYVSAFELDRSWLIRVNDGTIWSVPGDYARWGESCKSLTLMGSELVAERGIGVLKLYEYGAGKTRRLSQKVGGGIAAYALSPDFRQIAYTGQESDVWVRKLTAGPPRRLTATPRKGERVKFWSPDSRWIVAVTAEGVGDPGHFEAWDATTGKMHVLPFRGPDGGPIAHWHQVQWWMPGPPAKVDCSAAVQRSVGSGPGTKVDPEGYPPDGRRAQ